MAPQTRKKPVGSVRTLSKTASLPEPNTLDVIYRATCRSEKCRNEWIANGPNPLKCPRCQLPKPHVEAFRLGRAVNT